MILSWAFILLPMVQDRPSEQGGAVEQSVTKPKPQDEREKPKPKIEAPSPPDSKPQDDTTKFRVEKIRVTGSTVFSYETLREWVAPFEHQDLTLAGLKRIADRITAEYRDLGYLLSWAYVPSQDIRDGVVALAVVEGRIDRIVVGGNRHYDTDFVFRFLGSLQGGPIFSQNELERSLLILNDFSSLQTRATLRAGEKPGTTDVYIDVEDAAPVTVSFDYDNFGSEAISRDRFGTTLGLGNLWNVGHELTFRGLIGDPSDALRFARLAYSLPIESDGLKLQASIGYMDFEARGGILDVLEPHGNGPIYTLGVSFPWVKSRDLSLSFEFGFEGRDIEQLLGGVRASFDHVRLLNYGLSVDATDDWMGRSIVSFQLRDGIGDFNGSTGKRNQPSRAGASSDFTKFALQAYRIQRIMNGLYAIAKFSGQYCTVPLLASEQFGLGGNDSVRGYQSFEYAGDWGYATSLEFRMTPPGVDGWADPFSSKERKIGEVLQLAVFAEWGEAGLQQPRAGERSIISFEGVGAGLRINYPVLTVRLDVGFPLAKARPQHGEDVIVYVQVITPLH